MSLNIALYNAISGLQANSRALDVTAQNVSNVNTEGYSRKQIQQQSLVIAGQGSGVQIADIARAANEFMTAQLRDATTNLGDVSVRNEFYSRMQDLFGTLSSGSSTSMGIADLAAKFQALAETPENVSLRTDLVGNARDLVAQLNSMASQIDSLRVEVDRDIKDSVDIVNTQLSVIQDLNVQIAEGKALGQSVGELEDKRDIALKKLAEQMDIQTFTRSNGEVVVMTSQGRTLVDSTAATLDHTPVSSINSLTTYDSGGVDGVDLNGTDITSEISSGRLAGLIDLRDTTLPGLQSQLSELVTQLHDEVNALHNQGSAYPGLASVTSTRTFQGTDPPVWTGTFRVAVTDTSGTVVEVQDIDLSTMTDISDLVTAINGMTNVSASLNASGQIVITPTGSNRVAFNEMTSAVTVGNRTMGASDFLGLNDFFTSGEEYDDYASSNQASHTTALNAAGTLTFTGGFGTANVNYAAGDDLDAIAASINGTAALSAAGITASVITDGSGYRLRVTDGGGDNFFVTDSANLLSTLNLKARDAGILNDIGLRSDIVADPSLVSRGTLSNSGTLAAGDIGLTTGDKSTVQNLANLFKTDQSFDATNQLAASTATFAQYAAEIISLNATQANAASDNVTSRQVLVDNLKAQTASISGVNIDEEMSQMIILQNAYAASARVITVSQSMFDMLNNMLG